MILLIDYLSLVTFLLLAFYLLRDCIHQFRRFHALTLRIEFLLSNIWLVFLLKAILLWTPCFLLWSERMHPGGDFLKLLAMRGLARLALIARQWGELQLHLLILARTYIIKFFLLNCFKNNLLCRSLAFNLRHLVSLFFDFDPLVIGAGYVTANVHIL